MPAKNVKCPKLNKTELYKEVYHRTNLPKEAVTQILDALDDIRKECLVNGIEVPIGTIGFLSLKEVRPCENANLFNPKTQEHFVANMPGYRKTFLRVNKSWFDTLREQTIYAPWENEGKENENE